MAKEVFNNIPQFMIKTIGKPKIEENISQIIKSVYKNPKANMFSGEILKHSL